MVSKSFPDFIAITIVNQEKLFGQPCKYLNKCKKSVVNNRLDININKNFLVFRFKDFYCALYCSSVFTSIKIGSQQ